MNSAFITPPTSPEFPFNVDPHVFLKESAEKRLTILGKVVSAAKTHVNRSKNLASRVLNTGENVVIFYNEPDNGYYFVAKIECFLGEQLGQDGTKHPLYRHVWKSEGWGENNKDISFGHDLAPCETGCLSPWELLLAHYWNVYYLKKAGKTFDDEDLQRKGIFRLQAKLLAVLEERFLEGSPFPGMSFRTVVGV